MNKKNKKIYDNTIEEYKKFGLELTFSDSVSRYKLSELSDEYIKNKIDFINRISVRDKEHTGLRLAWLHIFTDVLIKRRIEKIKKLKDNVGKKIWS